MSDSPAVLTTAELADRWRVSQATVLSDWRSGHIPAPINPHQSRGYRWALATIEAFERKGVA